ncbi:hypothetical protein QJS10_CPB19g01668 [Acorus calamus]|uniref:heme oxygenase (biliverdin-producing) n=1 Tax=Acorus calamus TaxID=4465 RepID=A0AAV9CH78_ACOCL|nr:hypothetical protein QJS10_CPB19g01668 [Acorus calamus]
MFICIQYALPANPRITYSPFPKPKPIKYGLSTTTTITCCTTTPNTTTTTTLPSPPPQPTFTVPKKRKRYRKQYPGESTGITEEMRFVAMKLRNPNSPPPPPPNADAAAADTWQPSKEGFLKYLVDSRLVFRTLDRIVDESSHVAYAYFRRTGLERTDALDRDLGWFAEQGIGVPEPSTPGIDYSNYLEELAETNAPSFMCHFYNIYFAHVTGGRVIGKQVCERLLEGKELEFYRWEGDMQEMMRDVREKLNMIGEHWSRDEKNRCLREAAKSFKFSGQIVRLIILL